LAEVANVSGIILQERKVCKGKIVQALLGGHIGKGVHENPPLSSPGQVGDRKKVLLSPQKGLGQFEHWDLSLSADDRIDPIEVLQDLFVKEAGRITPKNDKGRGERGLHFFGHLHHVITLMMPMKIEGHDSGGFLPDIVEDREIPVLNPFHPKVKDLSCNAAPLKKIGHRQESHGKKIDP
jgi:hypothetical protein